MDGLFQHMLTGPFMKTVNLVVSQSTLNLWHLQWNLDITKDQGTGKIHVLYAVYNKILAYFVVFYTCTLYMYCWGQEYCLLYQGFCFV